MSKQATIELSEPGRSENPWSVYSPVRLPQLDGVHVVCERIGEPVHQLVADCWCGPDLERRRGAADLFVHRETY